MSSGDITRSTFEPARHYSSVRMQQGRVQLDADWNEQLDIQLHRDRATVVDTIGDAGAPKVGGGFALSVSPDGSDLLIESGRMWVGGLLCELGAAATAATVSGTDVAVAGLVLDETEIGVQSRVLLTGADGATALARVGAVDRLTRHLTLVAAAPALTPPVVLQLVRSYVDQPDLPLPEFTTAATPTTPSMLTLDDGTYLAYIDVWSRGITAVEAPGIVEPALGGPDTATRARTVWQVRLLPLTGAPAGLDATSASGPASSSRPPRRWPPVPRPTAAPPTTARLLRQAASPDSRTSSTACRSTRSTRPGARSSCGAATTLPW
jgi:hypothetical protein